MDHTFEVNVIRNFFLNISQSYESIQKRTFGLKRMEANNPARSGGTFGED